MSIWFTVVAVLAVGLVIHYLRTAARKPQLIYQANAENQQLLAQVPRLSRRFWVTPWLFNGHLQLLGLGLTKAFCGRLHYDHVDTLRMADGGTTALHWLGAELPSDVPTLVVLHTITGSPHSMRAFMRDLQRLTGWRVVLCQRRGHGELALTSARFNTMGDTEDLREQLRLIAERYPQSPLYAAGISAGTGLLIRYLGEQGDDTPLRGAFAYCPGYDISVAFARSRAPFTRLMARKLVRQFVTPNKDTLAHLPSFAALEGAQSLDEFHQHLYECAGYPSHQAFLDNCNPVTLMHRVNIPLLVLNAEDDPVCVLDNVQDHRQAMANMPRTILAVTARGSHCAYLAGLTAYPWAHHLAAEFLQALDAGAEQESPEQAK
ncbi:alpha/beta fold hydrolase [Pseudomonas berkeleyensis]|uniref:Alpha/beta fold hydrolase n=1 Tax=Pseudomonas berkeleyensis TaxID=2726956 RepID=A0A7G5DK45_9PSED|nr:alpha/beta fold hydrolase [Pseudomonas berkeleyensis]QMV62120.1 alpha/beta fold hydrolase [Pseudomonas berkeleyensis]WSO37561.1 alpha/beta fold hydrolase [Pseudomonas berkeleyensis]